MLCQIVFFANRGISQTIPVKEKPKGSKYFQQSFRQQQKEVVTDTLRYVDSNDTINYREKGKQKAKHFSNAKKKIVKDSLDYILNKSIPNKTQSTNLIDSTTFSKQINIEKPLDRLVQSKADKYNQKLQNPEIYKQFKSQLNGYKKDISGVLQPKDHIREKLGKRFNKLGSDYLNKVNDVNNDVAKQLLKAKQKYSTVSSKKNLEELPQNPLNLLPFKKRLIYGLNFQIIPGTPFKIDLSPNIAYKILPRWSAGLGFLYNMNLSLEERPFDDRRVGGRLFSEYHIIKGIFAHLEYESVWERNNLNTRTSNSNGYFGLAKKINIKGRLKGNFQLLYQLNNQPESFINNRSKFIYRFGFTID